MTIALWASNSACAQPSSVNGGSDWLSIVWRFLHTPWRTRQIARHRVFTENASRKADREVVPAGRRPAHTDSLRFRAKAGGHSMLCPYGFVGFLKRWGQER